jgi:hypothetical protein
MSNNKVLLTEEVHKYWADVIDHESEAPIKDKDVRNMVTAVLENMLQEGTPSNSTTDTIYNPQYSGTGDQSGYATSGELDPVLIKLVRRAMPALLANDLVGVQAMTGPTGLIFALRSYYGVDVATRTEAFVPGTGAVGNEFYSGNAAETALSTTAEGETLGVASDIYSDGGATPNTVITVDGAGGIVPADSTGMHIDQVNPWKEMSFSIEKSSVTAKTRALKAKYSSELAHDLRAIHGLDAGTELSNILSTEIITEQNREIIDLIYSSATVGAQNQNGTAYAAGVPITTGALGTFSLMHADGRWFVERAKMLLKQIVYEANLIAKNTGRGAANKLVVTPQVANALDMAAVLANHPGDNVTQINNSSGVGVTYAGTILGGRMSVYVDQFQATEQVCMGYKGPNIYDAGLFYCPYVPLQMMKAVGEEDFQPRIGFKTRYGLVANPFGAGLYYRKFNVINI